MSKLLSISRCCINNLSTFTIKVFRQNFSILLIVTIYSLAGRMLCRILDQGTMSNNTLGPGFLFSIIPPVFALIFLTKTCQRLNEGFTGLGFVCSEIRKDHFRFESIANLVVILIAVPIFLLGFHTFKIAIPMLHPFSWDELLMSLDFTIHLGNHPWSLVQPFLGYPEITRFIDYCYHHIWGGVLFTMILWMAWSPRQRLRKQFFLSFLLTWIILGTILATFFSSAGPCYFDKISDQVDPYSSLMVYLNSIPNLTAIDIQKKLWEIHSLKVPILYSGISAMPSIHVASAVLCALAGWELNQALGLALGLFSILIQLGSVHLGWHYAVDGYLSALLTFSIWKWMGRACKVSW